MLGRLARDHPHGDDEYLLRDKAIPSNWFRDLFGLHFGGHGFEHLSGKVKGMTKPTWGDGAIYFPTVNPHLRLFAVPGRGQERNSCGAQGNAPAKFLGKHREDANSDVGASRCAQLAATHASRQNSAVDQLQPLHSRRFYYLASLCSGVSRLCALENPVRQKQP